MKEIDFSQIKSIGGAQSEAFEELICYLASQIKNSDFDNFVNNNSRGGDGGVECYWKLNNGDEYGWQAKYFLTSLATSQWNQLKKSVQTAINKHPKLKKYVICIPRDLVDSRKEKEGKPTLSERDQWTNHVKKWQEMAVNKNIQVSFKLWGASEIRSQVFNLSNSATITDYWFGEKSLSIDDMKRLFERSRIALGERYSEETNVELQISQSLNTLAENDKWLTNTKKLIAEFYVNYHYIQNWHKDRVDQPILSIIDSLSNDVQCIESFLSTFRQNTGCIYDNDKKIVESTEDILVQLDKLPLNQSQVSETDEVINQIQIEQYQIISCRRFFENFLTTLQTQTFLAGKQRLLLLNGPAGSGKSHLLCDFARQQLSENQPVVHLLGQNYNGGDPTKFINESLHLATASGQLDYLELYGEMHNQRVVIIIDAVNEGEHRKEWKDFLAQLFGIIKSSKYLCLIISCRTTYQKFVIGDAILKKIPSLTHPGFSGNRAKAARKYLSKYDIEAPNVPFLSSEFTNPLFLRTVCTTMKKSDKHTFSKDMIGVSEVMNYYQKSIEANVSEQLDLSSPTLIKLAIDLFVGLIYPDHLWGVPYLEVNNLFDQNFSGGLGHRILEALIKEGFFVHELTYDGEEDIVSFAFERSTDFFVTETLLEKYNSVEQLRKAFLPDHELGKFIIKYSLNNGVTEFMCLKVPELFQHELVDLIDWKQEKFKRHFIKEQDLINESFSKTLPMRSPKYLTKRTWALFKQIQSYFPSGQKLEILIRLSLEPQHPWNAFKLDNVLKALKMPQRDAFWTTYIASHDYAETDDYPESEIRTILNWTLEAPLDKLSPELQKLLVIVLVWFTTTTNLNTRTSTERALTRLLTLVPTLIKNLITKYSEIDDPYLVDGLYASVYAAILQISDTTQIKDAIGDIPWGHLISKNQTNIVLRDSLTGIYEFAKFKGITGLPDTLFPIHKNQNLEEITFPSQTDIDKITESDSAIRLSAGSDFGDFGKYTMLMINKWSATRFNNAASPLTYKDIVENFFQNQGTGVLTAFEEFKALKKSKNKIESTANKRYIKKNPEFKDLPIIINYLDDDFSDNDFLNTDENEKLHEIDGKISTVRDTITKTCSSTDSQTLKRYLDDWDSDSIVPFDKPAAQRWVVKQSYDLGWKKELFSEFERNYCKRNNTPHYKNIERIGKKYERIALAELLAYISEQYYFIPQNYVDVDDSVYKGIWQFDYREKDLTFPLPRHPHLLGSKKKLSPWHQFEYKQIPNLKLSDQIQWLHSNSSIPDFYNIIQVQQDKSSNEWLLLNDFYNKTDQPEDYASNLLESDFWYRMNTCLIKTKDLNKMLSAAKKSSLMNPNIVYISNNYQQTFFSEYSWRNLYPEFRPENQFSSDTPLEGIEYQSLLSLYKWEDEDPAQENENYHPSRNLIEELNLSQNELGFWESDGELTFIDPSIEYQTRSRALILKKTMMKWLKGSGMTLVWLIGGEKNLYNNRIDAGESSEKNHVEFSGLYYMKDGSEILGNQHPLV